MAAGEIGTNVNAALWGQHSRKRTTLDMYAYDDCTRRQYNRSFIASFLFHLIAARRRTSQQSTLTNRRDGNGDVTVWRIVCFTCCHQRWECRQEEQYRRDGCGQGCCRHHPALLLLLLLLMTAHDGGIGWRCCHSAAAATKQRKENKTKKKTRIMTILF